MRQATKQLLFFIACVMLCLTPALSHFAFAKELTSDFQFPDIQLTESTSAVTSTKGKTTLTVRATDNVGIESVSLLYRFEQTTDYLTGQMRRVDSSDSLYTVTIDSGTNPQIQFYFKAVDLAGNSVLKGQSITPFTATIQSDVTAIASSSDSGNKRIGYYLLGAAAVALLVGLAGGGSKSGSSAASGDSCPDEGCQVNLLVTNP